MRRKPHTVRPSEFQNPIPIAIAYSLTMVIGALILGAAFNLGWHLIAGAC